MKDFFEKRSGLWGFLSFVLAFAVALVGWFFASNDTKGKISPINQNQVGNITNSGNIIITDNSSPVILGANNQIALNKNPTQVEESNEKQWQECETILRAFYRRLDRKDILSARNLFDEYMLKSPVFLEDRLTKYISERVAGYFLIEDLKRGGIDDSHFVARCEFTYHLQYTDAKTKILRNELWFGVILKDKDKVKDFQVGQLNCRDVACENSPLVNSTK